MPIYKSIYQKLCQSIKEDERYCLLCQKSIKNEIILSDFIDDRILCLDCEKKLKGERREFIIDGRKWIVYHEYNDFLERLLFQYKEQRDVALAPLFLKNHQKELKKLSKKYTIVTLCSSQEKRQIRAFEPIIRWFKSVGLFVYSPFYKNRDWKQSSYSYEKRKEIAKIIQRKTMYPLPKKPILLFDDVITSGATLKRAMELLDVKVVVVYAAHPLWIKETCEKM